MDACGVVLVVPVSCEKPVNLSRWREQYLPCIADFNGNNGRTTFLDPGCVSDKGQESPVDVFKLATSAVSNNNSIEV